MNDLPHVDLAALAARDLRLLLDNARRSGRPGLAAAVARELADRESADPGVAQQIASPARPSEPPKHRRAALAAAAAAALLVTSGGALLVRTWTSAVEPPREAALPVRAGQSAAVQPRANVALIPDLAPTSRKTAPLPAPKQVAVSPRAKPRDVPLTTARRSPEPLEPAARSYEPALPAPPPSPAGPQATGGSILAVSRSPSLTGDDCRGLESSERMVCEDGRRATASTRLARASTAPVRVSIARSEGASRLMAPGGSSGARAPLSAPR